MRQKKAIRKGQPVKIVGSGGWNRTNGLQVMSLTSYLCSTPQQRNIYYIPFFEKCKREFEKRRFFSPEKRSFAGFQREKMFFSLISLD